MHDIRNQIRRVASTYGLQIVYAFGSRAKEALDFVNGKIENLSKLRSDLDIGIKPERPPSISEKVEIALAFEDIFHVSRVDVVIIPEVSVLLSLKIVSGELLYASDPVYEAEYQLYIMRKASDLIPYERIRQKVILGF